MFGLMKKTLRCRLMMRIEAIYYSIDLICYRTFSRNLYKLLPPTVDAEDNPC